MKNIFWILLILPAVLLAQKANRDFLEPVAGMLHFQYDNAGNQTQRMFYLPFGDLKIQQDSIPILPEDFVEFFPGDLLSYYPNPVKEELYLKWEPVDKNVVTTIMLYSLNGQLLKEYKNVREITRQTIPFQEYPNGVYTVMLFYANGDQKSVKIIKQ